MSQNFIVFGAIAALLGAIFIGGSTLGIIAFVFVCLLLPIALAVRVTQLIRGREE